MGLRNVCLLGNLEYTVMEGKKSFTEISCAFGISIIMAVVLGRDGISEAPYKLYHKHPNKKTAQQRGTRTGRLCCQRQRQNSWLADGMALGNGMKCLESQF